MGGEEVLEMVMENLNARTPTIAAMLVANPALANTVREMGGWQDFSDAMHSGGLKAQRRFLLNYEKAVASLSIEPPVPHDQ